MSKIKPESKKLTLTQAIAETSKPSFRFGELICVQVDQRFGNLYAGTTDLAGNPFPAGELRAIFIPNGNDFDITEFEQPATESYLRDELYGNGGRIESLADFSDEMLAMFYEYRAGVTRNEKWVGAGDQSQFERDFKEALAVLPNVTPEIAAAVRKSIVNQHKKYKLPANEGEGYFTRQRESSKRLREDARKYTEQDHAEWEEAARKLKKANPALSVSAISQSLSKSLNVPKATIKPYLLKECRDLI